MLAPAAAIFSLLLIVTGVAKLARPHDLARALVALGLPRLPGVGWLIGGVEVVIGAGALLVPSFLPAQGALYFGFAVWVTVALRSEAPIASCGCLGRDDTPPTVAHILLNFIASALSLTAYFSEPFQLSLDLAGAARVLVVAVGVFLSYVILTDAARLVGVRRG